MDKNVSFGIFFFWYVSIFWYQIPKNGVINWVRVFLVVFRLFVTLTLIFCSKNSIITLLRVITLQITSLFENVNVLSLVLKHEDETN